MSRVRKLAGCLGLAVVFLAGCAGTPQAPVLMAAGHLSGPSTGRVGVVMSEMPKPDTQFPGVSCVLCMATTAVANSKLTDHTRTLQTEDIASLRAEVVRLLAKRGVQVVDIAAPVKVEDLPSSGATAPNSSAKSFAGYRTSHQVDRLLVIDLRFVGVERTYSAYIPTSDPKAAIYGTAFLVNLTNHAYEWYLPIQSVKSSEGAWDEPPKFPGITNAYFQAIEQAKDSVLKPLAQ